MSAPAQSQTEEGKGSGLVLAQKPKISVQSLVTEDKSKPAEEEEDENWEMVNTTKKKQDSEEEVIETGIDLNKKVKINGVVLPIWLVGLISIAALIILNAILNEEI